MRRAAPIFAISSTLVVVGISTLVGGCGEKQKYKPEPAYSGPKASLPKVPQVPTPASFKVGSSWTVYGLQHQLNHPRHRAEVDAKQAIIDGYVVQLYRPKEPAGKEGCIYPTKKSPPTAKDPTPKGVDCSTIFQGPNKVEPPHFWIADSKDEKNPAKMIMVMGYASSFIQQHMARDQYKGKKPEEIAAMKDDDKYLDNNYSATITILGEPKIGSKVTVSGQFGAHYEEGQGGRATSPYGIVDVTSHKKGKIDYKEGGEEIPELK
ncbi:MAG: hypothetical protein HYV09_09890 [Deltaproteobacteria bacterium]|nr:hypothetical protein [Deltaproteobacteria bacterium]